MEEIIDNFTSTKNFINQHKDVLEEDDYKYIYKTTKNDNIKIFLVDSGYILINDEQYITTLFEPKKLEILNKILENGTSINTQNKGKSLLDNTIINFINNIDKNYDFISEYFSYIIYILSKGAKGNLNVIYELVQQIDNSEQEVKGGKGVKEGKEGKGGKEEISKIYNIIIDIIDLLLLYESEKIEIDKDNELYTEVFSNMYSKDIEISDKLKEIIEENKDIVSIKVYNYINENVNIDNTIIKITENEKYMIYEEDSIRWVFNENDLKKIIEGKINPYSGKIISDKTIKYIKNNYKIDL